MEFRCKRYRICEVTRNVPRSLEVDRVFFIQRRWFGLLWVPQRIPPIYFHTEGLPFAGVMFPPRWRGLTWVFYDIEDAVDGLTAWLRATHKPDDYTVYITLPDSFD